MLLSFTIEWEILEKSLVSQFWTEVVNLLSIKSIVLLKATTFVGSNDVSVKFFKNNFAGTINHRENLNGPLKFKLKIYRRVHST